VQPAWQHRGIGRQLLTAAESQIEGPLLVGTWAAATWAIDFYQRNGFQMLTQAEKDVLLRRYWLIPEQQMANSVVLAKGYSAAA
jgi:N-acetylglutamate synthase-like GNAT family acetyltransferase